MGFRDCVGRAAASGDLDRGRAERILREYDGAFAQFQKSMGYTQAEIEAARHVVRKASAEAAEKRRVTQLAATASRRLVNRMAEHRNIKQDVDPVDFLQKLVSAPRGAKGATLQGQYEAVRRTFRGELTEAILAGRVNLLGMRRNRKLWNAVTREIFGESTGDARAKTIASSWARVAEMARTRANAAGMHIGKRADWGLPQFHNWHMIRKAGPDLESAYAAWRDFILPRIDLDAMGRDWNDGIGFTPETIEPALRDAFEKIRTDGYSARLPSARQGSAMYNRRADHRFFKFRDAQAWSEYNGRFGSGNDVFRIMLGHLDDMAGEIASMEVLGPNPNHTFAFLKDAALQMSARSPNMLGLDKGKIGAAVAQEMFDQFTGAANVPLHAGFAKFGSATRQYLTSSHLGSAILASFGDFNTNRVASAFAGFGQTGPVKMLFRLATSRALRREANDARLIFENAVEVGHSVSRFELEDLHVETAARLADFTIRASGLGWLTEVQRQAQGLSVMNAAAKQIDKSFDQLDRRTRDYFSDFGITPRAWEDIRQAKVHETAKGLKLLRSQEIEAVAGRDVADRYMEMIAGTQAFGVLQTDLYGKALVNMGTRPGSIPGEVVRFGMQFKAWPVTYMVTHMSRALETAYRGRAGQALGYIGSLFIIMSLIGVVQNDLKALSKGQEPRDKKDPRTWIAGIAAGGGLGLISDFVFADQNRFGGTLGQTLAGPGVAFLSDIGAFTLGNAQQALLGEETRIGPEFVNLLRRYTPGGSLWYARLIYQREILDQLQMLVDPKAHQQFRAEESRAEKLGTKFYWKPGRSAIQGDSGIRSPF